MVFVALFVQPVSPVFADENEIPVVIVKTDTSTEAPTSEPLPKPADIIETPSTPLPSPSDESNLLPAPDVVKTDSTVPDTLDTTVGIDDETDTAPETPLAPPAQEPLPELTQGSSTPAMDENNDVVAPTPTSKQPVIATSTEPNSELNATTTPTSHDAIIPTTEVSPVVPTNSPQVPAEIEIVENSQLQDIENNAVLDTEDVEADSSLASSTSASSTMTDAVAAHVYYSEADRYWFAENQCISVGDGSFYCTDASSVNVATAADDAYAALDAGGDKEIYITVDGGIHAITSNDFEDDAPYYDDASRSVVWHRLINGRYQIMAYDLKSETETQLTFGSENNMQSNRYGEVTVWQSWIDGDWDIVMDDAGERTVLTENHTHDVSPVINGDYIVWQAYGNEAWQVKVYDRRTGITETIEEKAGGSIENPRFVLVYDAKLDNGDVETRGYDLESGDIVSLSATPGRKKPVDIPNPETTGEERALIVPPTVSVKTKSASLDGVSGGGGPDGNTEGSNDQGTTTADVVGTTTPDIVDVIVTPYIESVDVDSVGIDIEANETASTSEAVFDVVIPPHQPKIDSVSNTEVDSQATVASTT
jgi:hypothetical protein